MAGLAIPRHCSMTANAPVRILVYKSMWGRYPSPPPDDCGVELCFERARFEEADAVVFHIPQLRKSGFPPRKRPGQLWVAWSMESERHYPVLAGRAELNAVFDLWMTYRRDSDVWCPPFEAAVLSDLRAPPLEKTAASPAALFVSGRYEDYPRAEYLAELMHHMPIDSYGRMHHNRSLPTDLGPATKHATIARYKFTFAFENCIDRDYVTEKLFDPLIAGSVPVYLGAPNVRDFAPGEQCLIDADEFDGPRALAAHLTALADDPEAYARYLRWKTEPLRPQFLAMVEEIRTSPFARLARLVRERLQRL